MVALLNVRGLHVALRVARRPDAQVRVLGAQVGDEVGRVREVLGLAAGTAVSAQRKHVLDARLVKLGNVGVDVGLGGAQAGEVRQGRHAKVALEGGGDGHRVLGVAGTTCGIGDGDPVRLVLGKGACHLIGLLEGEVSLGRKDLKREGLPGCELVGNLHSSWPFWSCGVGMVSHAGYGRMNEGMRPSLAAWAMSSSAWATESSLADPTCQRAASLTAGTAFATATELG